MLMSVYACRFLVVEVKVLIFWHPPTILNDR
jgi:hypothetical protein